jgi:hypothetical protein
MLIRVNTGKCFDQSRVILQLFQDFPPFSTLSYSIEVSCPFSHVNCRAWLKNFISLARA